MPQNLRNADNRSKGPSRKISSGSNQKPSEPKHQYTATFKFERVTPEMLAEIKKSGNVSYGSRRKGAAYGGKSSSEDSGHGFDNHLVGREKRYKKSADDYEKNVRKAESRIKLNPDEKIGKKIGEDQDKKLSHLSSQKTILRSGGKSLASQKEDQVSGAEIIKRRLKASRMPRMHTVDSRIVRRFPYKILFLAIVGTLLFMTLIYNNVQINEKTSEIAELRSELSALEADITDASLKVEKKNDLRVIEARAIELGMVKADQLSKKYVTIPSNDQITLIDDSDEEEENFHMTGIFEAIRQKISDLIDTFR